MAKKYFWLYLILCSAGFAMQMPSESYKANDAVSSPVIIYRVGPAREKTADQILAENRHLPEFMDISTWLKEERPDFMSQGYTSHALYPILVECMQLADFELDTLEQFTHMFMETDVAKENAEHIIKLRENSWSMKNLVGQVIDLIQKKLTIETFLTESLTDRFLKIIVYQAEILRRKSSILDLSNVKKVERGSKADDPASVLLLNAFMRSYNTKNKILRTLIYHVKDEQPTPLIKRLPANLISLLRLSTSLIPFFNKQTDAWIDYEQALSLGEGRNFLGNAAHLNINVRKIFKDLEIHNFPLSKVYRDINDHPIPEFLLDTKETKVAASTNPIERKKKKKNRKATNKVKETAVTSRPEVNAVVASQIESDEAAAVAAPAPAAFSSMQVQTPANTLAIIEEPFKEMKSETTQNSAENLPPPSSASSNVPQENEQTKKVRNKHVTTIMNIFRPKGYTSLNDTDIINAWEHVLGEKGYHKTGTGRSHQPLYAELEDNSRVVLGLFRSSGYGRNYIKYVREAFDKIGFGRTWLEDQGYRLE